jgi:hypothetical protein
LSKCGIDAEGGIALAAALKVNRALISLDLSNNNINVGGAKAFGAALKVNRTLTHLNLSENALCGKEKWMVYAAVPHTKDTSGVKAIAQALRGASWPDGALRQIQMQDNFLDPNAERLVTDAMDKPAVVAESRESARSPAPRGALRRPAQALPRGEM